jgi:hypothetical protein
MVEHLSRKHETLSSNPSTAKKGYVSKNNISQEMYFLPEFVHKHKDNFGISRLSFIRQ